MLHNMGHFSKAVVFLAILHCCLAAHSRSLGSNDVSTIGPSTTPHPITTKLEQLNEMEESSLKRWYDMVNSFLLLIKPDQRTIDVVINFFNKKHDLDPQETVLKIAKMNYAFLTMIIIGILYVCVMLFSGVFFLCCRCCGHCGAKDSQRQRRNDNCWRTMHKFCLILMIAFLVVPIICMCIINEHMKQSSPNVKGNISEVFNILIKFANTTDEDVEKIAESSGESPIQNFDNFKSHFVDLVHENITSSIDHDKLEEIKNIVSWASFVEDQHAAIANASLLSKAVQNLKTRIANIREQTKNFNCTEREKEICRLHLQALPIEKVNVDEAYGNVHSEFQKLLKIDFEELKSVIDQIQNNTILRNKIEEESESLKRFAQDTNSDDRKIYEKIKKEVRFYTDMLRKFANDGKNEVERGFAKSDGYEQYRWFSFFGIAAVLFVPVVLLTLGLICGCCGYEKERHPTKRSASSNCGGLCLLFAVYYFFLISSFLMVVTTLLFVLGGNVQTFICIPLYEKDFVVLDQMKDKLNSFTNGTIFEDLKPSKFLNDCYEQKSIIYALGVINESDPTSYEKLLKRSDMVDNDSSSDEIDNKLKNALLEITSGLREKLIQFKNALDLKEMKDLPNKLEDSLSSTKRHITIFVAQVQKALEQEPREALLYVNDSAAYLFEEVDEFQKKLNNFSATLLKIHNEADSYKEKIREIEESLDCVEEKLPKVIKAHLFKAVASSSGWEEKVKNIGRCFDVWAAFDIARTAVCKFIVNPVNGFWFALGWALIFIIPTIMFSVKLSRYYLRMKYDEDHYIRDAGEAVPLEDMSRAKPFSYTNPAAVSWMPQYSQHQNYVVHPTSNSQARQFHYK